MVRRAVFEDEREFAERGGGVECEGIVEVFWRVMW